jgi:Lar family restriction alleviation protein
MKEKLKRCPFCGGEAIVVDINDWIIECSKCYGKVGLFEQKEEAIKAWNARPEIDVEKLAEALHNAGLNAFTHPQSKSGEEWSKYRLDLAAAIKKHLDKEVR